MINDRELDHDLVYRYSGISFDPRSASLTGSSVVLISPNSIDIGEIRCSLEILGGVFTFFRYVLHIDNKISHEQSW